MGHNGPWRGAAPTQAAARGTATPRASLNTSTVKPRVFVKPQPSTTLDVDRASLPLTTQYNCSCLANLAASFNSTIAMVGSCVGMSLSAAIWASATCNPAPPVRCPRRGRQMAMERTPAKMSSIRDSTARTARSKFAWSVRSSLLLLLLLLELVSSEVFGGVSGMSEASGLVCGGEDCSS
jgi:hypothetical protein